jgi:hypothetical protein
VDAGITCLELRAPSNWSGSQGAALWANLAIAAVRLPAPRHLNLYLCDSSDWAQHGAAHMHNR